MASSLSNLVNNLSKGLHRIKCKFGHDDKNCETCGIKYKYCDCFLEYTNFKDDLIEYECSICNKNYQIKLGEKLKERFLININFYKYFEINNLREDHYLYVQSDTIFRNMCLEIYELDPAKFLSAPGLAWQAALKKNLK